MKHILFNAPVYCSDRRCGETSSILVNPQTLRVTHLVVKEASSPHIERLVPIELIAKASRVRIQLRCSQDEFKLMDSFVAIERHAERVPDYEEFKYTYQYRYNVPQKRIWIETKWKQIPRGELALYSSACVQATDGQVGTVAGLQIEPTSRRVNYLIITRRLLWKRRQIVLPVQQIEQVHESVVYLKLDKHTVDKLADGRMNQNLSRKRHLAEHV